MKLGIMQPYFFPYLGYWQLMNAVDTYVICDDVAFIKQGWIQRNRIKGLNGPLYIRLQIHNASPNRRINELSIMHNERMERNRILTLKSVYAHAPYFEQTMELFERIVNYEEDNLARFLTYAIHSVADYLQMTTKFLVSSELEKDNSLKAQDRVLNICEILGADTYINAIGGKELYDSESFAQRNLSLKFLRMDDDIVYPQGKGEFIPSLSILDVMMYNSVEEIRQLLTRYRLEN